MTPTPVPGTSPPLEQFWVLVGIVGLALVLLVVGLATGFVSFKPRKARESAARGIMALDAALSGAGRHAAIEYVLQDQDEVVLDDKRGDDDGDGDGGETFVVFSDDDQDAPGQKKGEEEDSESEEYVG